MIGEVTATDYDDRPVAAGVATFGNRERPATSVRTQPSTQPAAATTSVAPVRPGGTSKTAHEPMRHRGAYVAPPASSTTSAKSLASHCKGGATATNTSVAATPATTMPARRLTRS